MATSFSGGRSRSTRREPPTMGKQLVNFITCGCESSAPFFVIYKAGREPTPYWWCACMSCQVIQLPMSLSHPGPVIYFNHTPQGTLTTIIHVWYHQYPQLYKPPHWNPRTITIKVEILVELWQLKSGFLLNYKMYKYLWLLKSRFWIYRTPTSLNNPDYWPECRQSSRNWIWVWWS
jgi:hypothetical protein